MAPRFDYHKQAPQGIAPLLQLESYLTVEHDLPAAKRVMADLERLGISIDFVTTQLENEGIQEFIKAFDSILVQLAKARERALPGR